MQPVLKQGFQLGECPRWDEKEGIIWWVDILQQQLHCFNPLTNAHAFRQFNEQIGCFALREKGGVILAGCNGFWLMESLESEMKHIGDPEAQFSRHRFNDGRCDPAGRFIAGTMNPDKNAHYGQFYQVNRDYQIKALIGRSWTCNGLAFSPDGQTLYWSDTPERKIYQCDYNPQTGCVSRQRLFYQVPLDKGRPDGGSVDSRGNYWSALYGGGELLCISPQGVLLKTWSVPVTNPTMVTFGGADLQTMYITSARQKLMAEQLSDNPLEGCLLSCLAPYPGLVETRFAG